MAESSSDRLIFNGIALTAGNTLECISVIGEHKNGDQATVFHLVNTYTCTIFDSKKRTNPLLSKNSVNLIDGHWLRKFMELKSRRKVQGTRGPDVFERAFHEDLLLGQRHVLFGATNETLELLEGNLLIRSGGLAKLLKLSPPFRPLSQEELLDSATSILDFKPDVVWVGLGTPKQDFVAHDLAQYLSCPIVCVGAAFDFVAGVKKTAPLWMQRLGFEWLFRLASEPRRLWKRYLIGNIKFIALGIRDMVVK